MHVDQMHIKEKKDRQNAKKAESNTEPVLDADSDSLEPHKQGCDGPVMQKKWVNRRVQNGCDS